MKPLLTGCFCYPDFEIKILDAPSQRGAAVHLAPSPPIAKEAPATTSPTLVAYDYLSIHPARVPDISMDSTSDMLDEMSLRYNFHF